MSDEADPFEDIEDFPEEPPKPLVSKSLPSTPPAATNVLPKITAMPGQIVNMNRAKTATPPNLHLITPASLSKINNNNNNNNQSTMKTIPLPKPGAAQSNINFNFNSNNNNNHAGHSHGHHNHHNEVFDDEDEDDEEDVSRDFNPNPLSLKNRSISQTNFSGDWANKGPIKFMGRSAASSSTTHKIDADENFDDVFIPDNFAERAQRKPLTDDDFGDIEVPDDSYLSSDRLPSKRQKLNNHNFSNSINPNIPTTNNLGLAGLSNISSSHNSIHHLISQSPAPSPVVTHFTDRGLAFARNPKIDVFSEDEVQELGANHQNQFTTVKKFNSDGRELEALEIERKKSNNLRATSPITAVNPINKDAFTSVNPGPKPILKAEKPKKYRTHNSVFGQKAVVSTEVYGNGTELDNIEDVPVPADALPTPVFLRPNSLLTPSVEGESRKRKFHRPVLIQNLNQKKTRHVVGNMIYDPEKMRWEGNWRELQIFDQAHKPKKPALITQLGSVRPHRQNGMTFNEKTLRWEGNEAEEDIFQGIDMLDVPTIKITERVVEPGFRADSQFTERLELACRAHEEFLRPWTDEQLDYFLDDDDREHLFLIRAIASNR